MANEKKIAKNQKLFLSWLEHVIEVENQLQNAEDNKKIEKLQKKLKKNTMYYISVKPVCKVGKKNCSTTVYVSNPTSVFYSK